ncbi:uncharacterized protein [Antennarius striatus]|uniref:uncharacterized protein isoform X2 n=1 Tax=Antennarius striatus TaxID=241820 RepID=UPI0035B1BA67
MSNLSLTSPTERSATPPVFDNSTIMESSTSSPFELDIIAANDITSRANYVYSFLAGLGFVAGCFLLYSFYRNYRTQRHLAWLDCLLWAFCGFQLLLLLLSLHAVVHRPNYLQTTGLGCATLSFTINTVSLCGLLILALMTYVLTLDPPSHALLRKPWICGPLVILISVLISLLLAGLRGPRNGLQEEGVCFMDLVSAGVSYAAARLCLAFLIPYILQLGLLIGGCVRQWNSKGRFLSGFEERPMFLTVSLVMFFCHLFYSVTLLRGANLEKEGLSHHERAFLSVAEFVLFSGSSVSLLLVLLLHIPSRDSLCRVFRHMRDCCQRSGHTKPNRNIITPHVENADTLQDIES